LTVRVLAVDHGAARIGLALSDPSGTVARPLAAIPGRPLEEAVARIARLVDEHAVERVVVGLPLTLRGERGEQARRAERFAAALARALLVSVELYDERFTTRLAEGRGGTAPADARAAAVLLEGWLASHTSARAEEG